MSREDPGHSQAGFAYGDADDRQAWELAVLKPQVTAVQDWFKTRFGAPCTEVTAKEIAEVVLAGAATTRYVVLTRTPEGALDAYGPFRGRALATKTATVGYVGHARGSKATVLPLVPPYKMKGKMK